ncbi:MAG: hypothetical protein ACU0A2_00260 [Cognatishimia sp.]|uniref:hypothetical protein n=1 Tax=Cognatishimia sp. TaxID=2211648 RepID=UPI004059DA8D
MSDAFGLGLFADRYWANSALAMDQTVDHYGIQGTVTFDPFTVTAFAGRGWNHIGLSTDITGIDVGFQMDNGFDFGLFYRSEAGTGATIKQYGASVGYDISRGSAMPVYVTASFANTEFLGVGDSRLFRVGITIPLGQTVKRGETFFHPHSAQLDILSFVGTDTSGPAVP